MLILPDVDLMLIITFTTSCKTSSIKIWFVRAAGLAENMNHVVFRQPFVIFVKSCILVTQITTC